MQTGTHIIRQKLVTILLCIGWVVLFVKLASIQLVEHEKSREQAIRQRMKPYTIKANRGSILDRNGVQMAISQKTASYGIQPSILREEIENVDSLVIDLTAITGLEVETLKKKVESDQTYLWLVRQAEPQVCRRLDSLKVAMKLAGIAKKKDQKRYYPPGMVGAQIIGLTNIDGVGIEGCELFFNRELAGRDGRTKRLLDARGHSAQSLDEPEVMPEDGQNLVLTIDWRLQEIAEEELSECVSVTNAKWGGAILVNSVTGEILAMANVPRFDPNRGEGSNISSDNLGIMRNRLVTDMIEPGSTFKMVTFAEALESDRVYEEEQIKTGNGYFRVAGHDINDSHGYGTLSAREVLAYSSNIGTVKIAMRIGKRNLYERARLLGFGEKTGIDFPNETTGDLPNPRAWSELSLPTISFGQGVAVSPLQMVMSYCAVANDGVLMTPLILKEIQSGEGRGGRTFKPLKIRNAMSPQTAHRLTRMLKDAVEYGTGQNAKINGLAVAGKTGTAQRIREGAKGYAPGRYVSSFIGFIADREPRIVCLVMIDTPRGNYYASHVAAPVFKNIVNRMLNMGTGPWEPRMAGIDSTAMEKIVTVPDMEGMHVRKAAETLAELGVTPELSGDSTFVVHHFPLPGAEVNKGSVITLYSDAVSTREVGRIRVPNLIGKTMREAVQDLVQSNLEVNIEGSGVVVEQAPTPGSIVENGTVCMIACKRE